MNHFQEFMQTRSYSIRRKYLCPCSSESTKYFENTLKGIMDDIEYQLSARQMTNTIDKIIDFHLSAICFFAHTLGCFANSFKRLSCFHHSIYSFLINYTCYGEASISLKSCDCFPGFSFKDTIDTVCRQRIAKLSKSSLYFFYRFYGITAPSHSRFSIFSRKNISKIDRKPFNGLFDSFSRFSSFFVSTCKLINSFF